MKLLSIIVLTYKRPEWLKICLEHVSRAVSNINDVEVLVSDDCGDLQNKNTCDLYPSFIYRRNEVNLNISGHCPVAAQAATGKYVWIIGEDDLIYAHSVGQFIQEIKKNEFDIYHFNTDYWWPDHIPNDAAVVANKKTTCPRLVNKNFHTLKFIRNTNPNFVTPIYSFFMKREMWVETSNIINGKKMWETFEATLPHAIYIIDNLSNTPSLYLGTPMLLASYNVTWNQHMDLYLKEWLPKIKYRYDSRVKHL